jgi:hypothetical protein
MNRRERCRNSFARVRYDDFFDDPAKRLVHGNGRGESVPNFLIFFGTGVHGSMLEGAPAESTPGVGAATAPTTAGRTLGSSQREPHAGPARRVRP